MGKHAALYCDSCHAETTDGFVITDQTKHLNNTYNVSNVRLFDSYVYNAAGGTCTNVQCHVNKQGYRQWGAYKCDACHGAPPNTPSHMKHFSGTAAQASYTSVKSAQDFSDNASGYIFNCANCHPIDINKHGNGTVEIELYNPSAPAGSIKSDARQAGAFYTKGVLPLKDERGFRYSNGTCGNVYCHSYSDWKTPGVENCMDNYSTCDKAAVASLVQTREYRNVTWNGSLPKNCTGCHANGPRTRSETNYGSTGNNHSWINNDYYEEGHFGKYYFTTDPISCTFCHNGTVTQLNNWSRPVIADPYTYYPTAAEPYFTTMSSVPIANFSKHVNGKADVNFDKDKTYTVNFPGGYSTPPKTTFYKMSTSTYSAETKSCSNVACHLGQSTVKWGTPYKAYKYNVGEDYGCRKCHDNNHPYVSF
jgi:predicted CxxxxCH...CXXCH cytochrome family protein